MASTTFQNDSLHSQNIQSNHHCSYQAWLLNLPRCQWWHLCSSDSKLLNLSWASVNSRVLLWCLMLRIIHNISSLHWSFLIHQELNLLFLFIVHWSDIVFESLTFQFATINLSEQWKSWHFYLQFNLDDLLHHYWYQCQLIQVLVLLMISPLTGHEFLLFLLDFLLVLLAFFSPLFCPLFGIIDFLLSAVLGYSHPFYFLHFLLSFNPFIQVHFCIGLLFARSTFCQV